MISNHYLVVGDEDFDLLLQLDAMKKRQPKIEQEGTQIFCERKDFEKRRDAGHHYFARLQLKKTQTAPARTTWTRREEESSVSQPVNRISWCSSYPKTRA